MIITEAAVAKMSSVIDALKLEAPDTNLFFRIDSRHSLALGAGCIGIRYALTVDHDAKTTDIVETHGSVELRVDPVSWILAKTLTLDTRVYDTKEDFVLTQDPDVTLCYCGSSHNVVM